MVSKWLECCSNMAPQNFEIVAGGEKEISAYDLGHVQKNQEEAALQAVIDDAKARGVDPKTIKAAQKCFERHIPAFILRAA